MVLVAAMKLPSPSLPARFRLQRLSVVSCCRRFPAPAALCVGKTPFFGRHSQLFERGNLSFAITLRSSLCAFFGSRSKALEFSIHQPFEKLFRGTIGIFMCRQCF